MKNRCLSILETSLLYYISRTNPKSKLMLLNDGGKFKVQMPECSFTYEKFTDIGNWKMN